MKLEILGSAYAEAVIDLLSFMDNFSVSWDLEKAIKDNTKVTFNKCSDLDETHLKNMVWTALDWGGLIEALGESEEDKMTIKFYIVKYSEWNKLYPGMIDRENKEVVFSEYEENGHGTMLMQSLIKNINFDIKSFVKNGCFLYASTDKLKLGWLIR